jgi:hypothetical protein
MVLQSSYYGSVGKFRDNSNPSTGWSSFSITCSHFQTHMTPAFFGCAPRYARQALVPSRTPPDKWRMTDLRHGRDNWSMASPLEPGDLNTKNEDSIIKYDVQLDWFSGGNPGFLTIQYRGVPMIFPLNQSKDTTWDSTNKHRLRLLVLFKTKPTRVLAQNVVLLGSKKQGTMKVE